MRFSEDNTTVLTGEPIVQIIITIVEGWNLISGITESIAIINISDPSSIIINGTVFGFGDVGYIETEVLEPGKGYWIRSTEDGSITISSQNRSGYVRLLPVYPDANTLRVNGMEFYFGENISEIDPAFYSLPPKPPPGATDVRFSGDTKLCISNECLIEVTGNGKPLKFDCNIKDGEEWQLVDESGKEYICSDVQEKELHIESGYIALKKITTLTMPQSFSLSPAYPNPFNPSTRIRFTVLR